MICSHAHATNHLRTLRVPLRLAEGEPHQGFPHCGHHCQKIGGVFAGGPRVLGLGNRPTLRRHPLTEVEKAGTALA